MIPGEPGLSNSLAGQVGRQRAQREATQPCLVSSPAASGQGHSQFKQKASISVIVVEVGPAALRVPTILHEPIAKFMEQRPSVLTHFRTALGSR
jgi:hypothetical protein